MTDILKRNNVTIKGTGSETIIFAHGFGFDKNTWNEVTAAFENEYRLVLFDYVGAGQSDISSYNSKKYSTLNGYAQDIIDICRTLDISQAILIGHSVSCMIAVIAAVREPSYFSKLVFVSPSPYFFNDGEYKGGLEKQDIDDLFEMMDSNYLGWSSLLAPSIMGNPDRPELADGLYNSFCKTDPVIAKEFAKVTFYSDNRSYLQQLKVESLTLQCRQDMLAPEEVGIYIQEKTLNNSMVCLDATGHCPHLSAPDEIISTIGAYLKSPSYYANERIY